MAEFSDYSRITPELEALAAVCLSNNQINKEDYVRYNVKRGLRDLDGTGVLAGLTEISEIISSKVVDGKKVPCEGELYYRGYPVEKLTGGFIQDKRFGFEETAYLLMFGQLPTAEQLKSFNEQLAFYRSLPTNFVRDVILKAPSSDMMNTLARCVLTMASYDDKPDDISLPNVVRQCIDLIAIFPLISVYAYQAYNHYKNGNSLYIHTPAAGPVHRGEHPHPAAAGRPVHHAGGPHPGPVPCAARGARRRQQLHLHHPRGHQLRPRRAVNTAVHTATAEQRVVRCIDNRVHMHFGDITLDNL